MKKEALAQTAVVVMLAVILSFGGVPMTSLAFVASRTSVHARNASQERDTGDDGETVMMDDPEESPAEEEERSEEEPAAEVEESLSDLPEDEELAEEERVNAAEASAQEEAAETSEPNDGENSEDADVDIIAAPQADEATPPEQPSVALGGRQDDHQASSIHDHNADVEATVQSDFPSAYNSVEQGFATPGRDQGVFGTCWSFSTIAAIESSMLRRGPSMGFSAESLDLSERHLAYFTYNMPSDPLGNTIGDRTIPNSGTFATAFETCPSYLNNGGYPYMASNALMSRVGPVSEDVAPYSELRNRYMSVMRGEESYEAFLANTNLDEGAGRANPVVQLKQVYRIRMTDLDDVKQAVMDYGAAVVSVRFEYRYLNYTADTFTGDHYFYNGSDGTNHFVTIVGWDDGISSESFGNTWYAGETIRPQRDGAWLCKNSWGQGADMGQYFWLSYEDACAIRENAYVFEVESPRPDEHVYQYDGTNSWFYNHLGSGGSIANVYETKANDKGELLQRVSFSLESTNVDYSIQVYTDLSNPSDPTSGTPRLSKPLKGRTSYEGIYMVDLPDPVELLPHQTYSIVITVSHRHGETVDYSVDASLRDGWYLSESVVAPGQSFERDFAGEKWTDLVSTETDEGDEPECCARIKAFTTDADLSSRMDLGHARIELAQTSYIYNGKARRPKATVVLDGRQLAENVAYTVAYKNNVNVGTASVTVTGMGGYTGSRSATFKITKAASTIKLAAQTKTYTGKAVAYTAKVTRTGSTAKVTYAYYSDAKCTKPVKAANVRNAGAYYVRATVAADKNHKAATSPAVKLTIARASISKASIAKIANQPYTGKAVKPKPTVKLGGATLKSGTDYTLSYKENVKAGTAKVTATGKGNYTGTKSASFRIVKPGVTYQTHVQGIGDQGWRSDGKPSGTFGQSKRLEGIWIKLGNKPVSGSVRYRTHVQGIGDQEWRTEGEMSGTSGLSKRLEAIQIKLTGNMAKHYDIFYRVHAQRLGWMDWAKNGERSGTAGYSYRLEAIQIVLLPKGSKAPAADYGGYVQTWKSSFERK